MHCAAINVFGRPIHSHAQMAFAIVELLARANRSISFSLRELIYNKASLEEAFQSGPARTSSSTSKSIQANQHPQVSSSTMYSVSCCSCFMPAAPPCSPGTAELPPVAIT